MADQRITLPVKIIDSTNTNVVGVQSNTLSVNIGNVAPAALADATSTPTTSLVGAFIHGWNGASWDRCIVDGNKILKVAVFSGSTQMPIMAAVGTAGFQKITDGTNTVSVSSGGVIKTELPTAVALTSDAVSSPTSPAVANFGFGYNGTNWDRIRTANTGRLQVDVVTGGGTDSPTTPVVTLATASAVSAGGTGTAAVTGAGFKAKFLWQADFTSSVPWKAILSTEANGVLTSITTLFGDAGQSVVYRPPHRNFVQSGNTGGTDGFSCLFTNLDSNSSADMYLTTYSAVN